MNSDMPDSVKYFVVAMKRRRLSLGMTQQEVADRSGISLATVNQIEGFKRADPDWGSIEKIAHALNDSVDNLIWYGKDVSLDEYDMMRKAVGARIAELRSERGWTRHMLSLKSSIAPSHINNIEVGKISPSLDKLFQISRALGVTLKDLF